MKKTFISLLLLLGPLFVKADIYDNAAFKLGTYMTIKHLDISNNYILSDTIIILPEVGPISGLSVSGSVELQGTESVVRIILIDKEDKEYLVFEDYYLSAKNSIHSFNNVALETILLDSVIPQEIRVIVRNSLLNISEMHYNMRQSYQSEKLSSLKNKIKEKQQEYVASKWNESNRESKLYWYASSTMLSQMSYTEKKRYFNATDDGFISDGFEYYAGGIFYVRNHKNSINSAIEETAEEDITDLSRDNEYTTFVDYFDWRNRHGKNWVTSVKNQLIPFNSSGGGGCWAFSACAAVESSINLYYNQLLYYDLSEQQLSSCPSEHSCGSFKSGGYPDRALDYIRDYGVVTEECLPFYNDDSIPCEEMCTSPVDLISIQGYNSIMKSETTLKKALISFGPLSSGFSNGFMNHALILVGFSVAKTGDTIKYSPISTNQPLQQYIIDENSPYVGQTIWIFKDSAGENSGNGGFLYIVFQSINTFKTSYKINHPIYSNIYSSTDIRITDEDNDGYYFWGLGPKPSNCPICCPDIPDGDDSNPAVAEMNEYGVFNEYEFPYHTLTITEDTCWNTDLTQCGNIIITNNATLTLSAILTMNPAAKIIIKEGGTLVVDAGSIVNSNIIVKSTGHLILLNNGTLYQHSAGALDVQFGGTCDMNYGQLILAVL
ncbi:MAG: hypothetical protein IJ650_02495 [Paludibacteraceae bacterium]|nr:hypothetical protein [Paludibacteraceae bacterium]